jgi:glycosyltransferase involved in cell wall biosynthesis
MRALILAYEFVPFTSVAVQRPYSWFRFFKEFGIQPTVVTRQWSSQEFSQKSFISPSPTNEVVSDVFPEGQVIRAPFHPNLRDKLLLKFGYAKLSLLRRFLTLLYLATEHYFEWMDRDYPIYLAAREHLRRNKEDVIIATGGPFILFRYASRLSKEFGIPWVADFRDGWYTHENFRLNDPLTKLMHRVFLVPREKAYLKTASFATVASPSYISKLRALHPAVKFETVYNGFVADNFLGLQEVSQPEDVFTISYAGTIYDYQRLDVFIDGFCKFKENYPSAQVKIYFYGTKFYVNQYLRVKRDTGPISEFVEITDRIGHDEVLRHMRSSHVLLLLANRNYCALATKVYEYLAAGRQILLCENDHGVLEEIIGKTRSGYCATDAEDTSAQLGRWYREFLETGAVQGTTSNIGFYDRRNQAGIYADLLHKHCLKSSESKQMV